MGLARLCLVGILIGGTVAAQPLPAAAAGSPQAPAPAAPPPSARTADTHGADAVSLDHIREALKKDARESLLLRPELPADFRVQVLTQQKIDDLLSKLDFKTGQGPAPAGGLYGYEQQRRLFNPVDRPLAQPYAAFSGGELITVAIENLIAHYLGPKLVGGIVNAERERAERAAREEVAAEIAAYCAARPDRADIYICAAPADR